MRHCPTCDPALRQSLRRLRSSAGHKPTPRRSLSITASSGDALRSSPIITPLSGEVCFWASWGDGMGLGATTVAAGARCSSGRGVIAPGGRWGSTGRLSAGIRCREGYGVLLGKPEQQRAPVQPLGRALVPLARVGLVPGDEADFLQYRKRAAHPGFGQAQILPAGDRPPIDREAVEEPPGSAPEPPEPRRQGEGRQPRSSGRSGRSQVCPRQSAASGRRASSSAPSGRGSAIGAAGRAVRHRQVGPVPESVAFRLTRTAISGDDPSCSDFGLAPSGLRTLGCPGRLPGGSCFMWLLSRR